MYVFENTSMLIIFIKIKWKLVTNYNIVVLFTYIIIVYPGNTKIITDQNCVVFIISKIRINYYSLCR